MCCVHVDALMITEKPGASWIPVSTALHVLFTFNNCYTSAPSTILELFGEFHEQAYRLAYAQ